MRMVRVARGASSSSLTTGATYGPYPAAEIQQPFDLAVQQLLDEGFSVMQPGWDLVAALDSPDPKVRARAAIRLGWRRRKDVVPKLLEVTQAAIDANRGESCSLIDALGLLGDERAIPLARQMAERKNLSRRRSGVEALRNLGDTEGLAQARQRGFDRLPPPVQKVLEGLDETAQSKAALKALVDAAKQCDARRFGLIADVLYEAGTPVTVAAARRVLAMTRPGQPHTWRYARSVLRRAMLRRDHKTFGFLAHHIERETRTSKGSFASLKSGFDGQKKHMPVFRLQTQLYVKRLTWRYLRDLAHWEPSKYALHAAEVLVHYAPQDLRPPKGFVPSFGSCYLLGRILYGRSKRLREKNTVWRHVSYAATKPAPAGTREEAFPAYWDAGREAYLRVLSAAKLPDVFGFGLAGLQRHPDILQHATTKQLTKLLETDPAMSAGTPLVSLVLTELDRRFDPADPDMALLMRFAASPASHRPEVRAILRGWVTKAAPVWTRDEQHVFGLPMAVDGGVRAAVVDALVAAFGADPALRAEHIDGFLAILQKPEDTPGQYGAFAAIARQALVAELDQKLDDAALLAWLDEGSSSGRSVAGAILGARPGALEVLGMARLVTMADDEVAAVRGAAHALLRGATEQLRADPSVLFALAETPWDDTRAVVFDLLTNAIDLVSLGLPGLIGLCDSSDPEVEALGRDLVVKHFEELDPEEVLYRLSEHPSRRMQLFALGLMQTHLRPGYIPLARLEAYFCAVLYDVWPTRRLKHGVLALLLERGRADERQGELVAAILGPLLRTHTAHDFDRVASVLAQVQALHPSVTSDLKLAKAMTAPEAAS